MDDGAPLLGAAAAPEMLVLHVHILNTIFMAEDTSHSHRNALWTCGDGSQNRNYHSRMEIRWQRHAGNLYFECHS